MTNKIKVGILFGGRSVEHEVSLQSAKNVIEAINKEKYEPILIGIDKQGRWFLNDATHFLLNADNPKSIQLNQTEHQRVTLIPQNEKEIIGLSSQNLIATIDVAFPILHGPYGEDGTIQGLLKLANIPFVGAGVLGSAIGMDKDVMKRLLRDANIPTAEFMTGRNKHSFDFASVVQQLGTPFFVKTANAGSSVGISKVENELSFEKAVSTALAYDTKFIAEKFIKGREIECSVLGNNDPIASLPGEVIVQSNHPFYTYEAKYLDAQGASLKVPANLPTDIIKKIQSLAIKTFNTLECAGLARVDFFLREDGEVFVNEINTIPGFTPISMYPMLWEASGIRYTDLIDKLITLAFERFNQEEKIKTCL